MVQPISVDDIVLPALLRAARPAYANAIRAALRDAGFEDVPKNGAYVIGAISRAGAPLADIIRGLGVSKQAAGQLIDTLVLRGYLEREVNDEDRRRLTMTLTQRGRAAAAVARKASESVDAKLKKRVGEKAIAEARKVLFHLVAIANEGQQT
ncbi:MAG: MarR family winged helix-turn-helix transcriptional regulator [Rhizomicrobium sp.]